jgi:hypothetical protein
MTKVLLSYLDIAQTLLERNLGRSPQLRTAFLEYLRDHYEELGENSSQRRDHTRYLAIQLNLRGGMTLLDSLDEERVTSLLVANSQRWQATEDEE